MEVKKLIDYDMKRVISKAKKEFGIIERGTEENYNPQLDYIEHKIYKVYEEIPISDRELKEVIEMVIYDLKSIIDNIVYDYSDIRDKKLIEFAKNLEMLFNPFLNKEIQITKDAQNDLKNLFTLPIKCLLRIYDSIDFWHERYGINGYYKMLEEMVLPFLIIGQSPYALEFKYLNIKNQVNANEEV